MSETMPDTYREAWRRYWTYPGPRIVLALVVATIILRGLAGDWRPLDALCLAAGFAFWPLLEWSMHRYILHIKPFEWRGRRIDFDFARRHRAHHAEPQRPELIFLPAPLQLATGPALLALAWFAFPDRGLALSALTGFMLAALNYEWTHYLVHTRIHPQNAYYRRLFRHHRMHHFRNENYWFGFTVTGIDRLLGTGPQPESTPRSASTHDLGVTQEPAQQDATLRGRSRGGCTAAAEQTKSTV